MTQWRFGVLPVERSPFWTNRMDGMTDVIESGRLEQDGMTYEAFREDWKARKDRSMQGLDPDARKMMHYLRYNWERQGLVEENYTPSEALVEKLQALQEPQVWMVLTEPWCGDSAFILPVIARAAAESDRVTLRILPRDENLDVMDAYLTGGSRSIPKLVAFRASDGEELFTWGPRPEPATQLREDLVDAGKNKNAVVQELVAYYEDGGYEAVDRELTDAVTAVVPTA